MLIKGKRWRKEKEKMWKRYGKDEEEMGKEEEKMRRWGKDKVT
jgi:hypothetical protein